MTTKKNKKPKPRPWNLQRARREIAQLCERVEHLPGRCVDVQQSLTSPVDLDQVSMDLFEAWVLADSVATDLKRLEDECDERLDVLSKREEERDRKAKLRAKEKRGKR